MVLIFYCSFISNIMRSMCGASIVCANCDSITSFLISFNFYNNFIIFISILSKVVTQYYFCRTATKILGRVFPLDPLFKGLKAIKNKGFKPLFYLFNQRNHLRYFQKFYQNHLLFLLHYFQNHQTNLINLYLV